MTRFVLLGLFFFFTCSAFAQADSTHLIYVHILHGSKPKREFREDEYKMLGGMYGGHVVIQVDSFLYGFNFGSGRVHPFARRKKAKMVGILEKEDASETLRRWKNNKITTIAIPLDAQQYRELLNEAERLHADPSFDYAFFGMRCAATCYYLLGDAGVIRKSTRFRSIRKAFDPKQLRKKLVRIAHKRNYVITVQPGSERRKWEGD